MTAIDKSRIVGQTEDLLDEFSCGICHEVIGQPLVTPCCQQPYCKPCITQWLARDNTCPNDRKPLTITGLTTAPRFVANFIDKMKVKCRYSGSGCPSVHNFGEDANHSKVCRYGKCRHCGAIDDNPDHDCLSRFLKNKRVITDQLKTDLEYNLKTLEKLREKNSELIRLNSDLKSKEVVMKNEIQKLKTDLSQSQSANATAGHELAQLRQEVNDLRSKLQEVYVGNIKYSSKKVAIGQLDCGHESIFVSLGLDYHPMWDRVMNTSNWDDVIFALHEADYYRDTVFVELFDMIEEKIRSFPRFRNWDFRQFYEI